MFLSFPTEVFWEVDYLLSCSTNGNFVRWNDENIMYLFGLNPHENINIKEIMEATILIKAVTFILLWRRLPLKEISEKRAYWSRVQWSMSINIWTRHFLPEHAASDKMQSCLLNIRFHEWHSCDNNSLSTP